MFHKWFGELFKGLLRQQISLPGGSVVKNPPPVQETQVWSLGREGLLEKEMATHPSILAWEISWTEEPGRLQSKESQSVGHNWARPHNLLGSMLNISCTSAHFSIIRTRAIPPYLRYRDVLRCSDLPKVTGKIAWLRFQFYKERIEVEVSSPVASSEDNWNAFLTHSLLTILIHFVLGPTLYVGPLAWSHTTSSSSQECKQLSGFSRCVFSSISQSTRSFNHIKTVDEWNHLDDPFTESPF